MKYPETIGGYVVRHKSGDLRGLKCPVSKRLFVGPNAEREQYAWTALIYSLQGPDIQIQDRVKMYGEGNGVPPEQE